MTAPANNICPHQQGVSTFNIGQVQALPLTFQDIKKATRRDKVLSKITVFVQEGWPNHIDEELKPYNTWQAKIGIEGGCLMWGDESSSQKAYNHKS